MVGSIRLQKLKWLICYTKENTRLIENNVKTSTHLWFVKPFPDGLHFPDCRRHAAGSTFHPTLSNNRWRLRRTVSGRHFGRVSRTDHGRTTTAKTATQRVFRTANSVQTRRHGLPTAVRR